MILSWRFIPRYGWFTGIGKGFFQAVSAFCNAGFDLHGDTSPRACRPLARLGKFSSLIAWNDDPVVILTTGLLIVIGGLGFVVWSDLLMFRKTRKLNFHTKVVLAMTGMLLTVGTIVFLVTEWGNTQHPYSLGSLPAWQRPLAALFQSITPRTAGFNSIDQTSLD